MRMLLEGAINALGKVGLMLNVHKDDLQAVLAVLPALKRPTISHLSDEEWLAVNTILDESTVRDIIPRLKEAGGAGHRRISAEQDRAVIRILASKDVGRLLARKAARFAEAEAVVRPILEAVRKRGDSALLEYARKFDGLDAQDACAVPRARTASGARQRLAPEFRARRRDRRGQYSRLRRDARCRAEWSARIRAGPAAGADRAAARYGGGVHSRRAAIRCPPRC